MPIATVGWVAPLAVPSFRWRILEASFQLVVTATPRVGTDPSTIFHCVTESQAISALGRRSVVFIFGHAESGVVNVFEAPNILYGSPPSCLLVILLHGN